MNFKEYQNKARETAIYPEMSAPIGLAYCALGLAGEAGETAEKVKKFFRDDESILSVKRLEEIEKELGDTLWYISNMCSELNIDLERIAISNIDKLISRKNRDKLHGSGDNR